jgi:hypothetical protein
MAKTTVRLVQLTTVEKKVEVGFVDMVDVVADLVVGMVEEAFVDMADVDMGDVDMGKVDMGDVETTKTMEINQKVYIYQMK